ncbi:peptidoglycan-binding domain-containing protein [Ferrovibrio terrae]|nr:peptidoglycan-binding domain-containing protein [Ferrovibrio terrae]
MSLLPFQNPPDDLFSFSGSVGRFGDNNRDDVIKAQALLANSGYYELPDPGMPTGWPGGELNRALMRFQKDHGLEPDGTLLPLGPFGVGETGVGETLSTLKDELRAPLEGFVPPSVKEVDDFYRLRPALDGNGKPITNVYLRSGDGGSGEPIGLKPSQVMSDEPPEQFAPKAGEQTALLAPAVQVGTRVIPQIPNLLRGLGILAPAAMLPLSGDSQQPTDKSDNDAQREPERAQPEEDRQQQDFAKPQHGRIIIAEDGKELHVPPLGTWAKDLSPEDRQIADVLNDAFAIKMQGLHTGGSRGNALTQEGVNMAIEECVKVAREIFPDATVGHIFGGNPEGDADIEALKEEHLWNYDENGKFVRQGSNRPDFGIAVARDIVEMVRGNTFDSDGAGNPDDREATARDGIKAKTPGERMVMLEKRGSEMSEQEFRRNAREACLAAFIELREDWEKRGELKKPASKIPKDYKGPESAQRAKDQREKNQK